MKRSLSLLTAIICMVFILACSSSPSPESNPADIEKKDIQVDTPDPAISDEIKALEYKAAQGDAKSQFDLGLIYYAGRGVKQDYAKARELWEKVAEQGYATAQYNLGTLYYNGRGVEQNTAMAKEWFGKACDNGYKKGCDGYKDLSQQGH